MNMFNALKSIYRSVATSGLSNKINSLMIILADKVENDGYHNISYQIFTKSNPMYDEITNFRKNSDNMNRNVAKKFIENIQKNILLA